MELTKEYTNRGFAIYKFNDLYNSNCSLQESSLATDDAIWLGCDDVTYVKNISGVEMPYNTRMHLNRDMAKILGEKLLKFAEIGEI